MESMLSSFCHVVSIQPKFVMFQATRVRVKSGEDARRLTEEVESREFNGKRFSARVEGFGAFGERTVFARVLPSEAWLRIRDAVLHAVLEKCPHCTKKDTRPFQPHITIANRDIPAGATAKALIVLNDTALRADFPADNIAVFERENGLWRTAVVIEL